MSHAEPEHGTEQGAAAGQVLGYDYDGDVRAVDTHIRRLRDKLGEHAVLIKTVVKAGYCLEV